MEKISKTSTLPPNRNFGFLFAFVFVICAAHFFLINKLFYAAIFFALTLLFLVLAIFTPSSLASLNRTWFLLGVFLGKIVSPLVLGTIFFLLITPAAIISRILGRDVLLLKKRQVASYWVDKEPIEPNSFKNQF